MRKRIEEKMDQVVEAIIAKDPKEITYSEYKILECRSKDLMYREEQKQKNEEMAQLMSKTLGYGFGSLPASLPEPEIKEE